MTTEIHSMRLALAVGLIAISTSTHAGFRDEREVPKADQPAASAEPAARPNDGKAQADVAPAAPAVSVAAEPPKAPEIKEPAPPKMHALDIGKTISMQMIAMAESNGWRLIWEAPDFSLEHPVSVSADFAEALKSIISSANESGARLRADFFRGNQVVRVKEF
jgi:hypothetical protein